MAQYSYTHGYDHFYKLLTIFGGFIGGVSAMSIPTMFLSVPGDNSVSALSHLVLALACGIAGGALTVSVIKTLLPEWIPTYMYVRFSLGIPITQIEAQKLDFLFSGSHDGYWLPLTEISKLRPEEKHRALLLAANSAAQKIGGQQLFY